VSTPMAFERETEAATARRDLAFLDCALADDFVFTHGDAWRTGEKPSLVDTKNSWMAPECWEVGVCRLVRAGVSSQGRRRGTCAPSNRLVRST